MIESPSRPHAPQNHDRSELDRLVEELQSRKADWQRTSIDRKIDYLRSAIASTHEVAAEQAEAAARAKGVPPRSAAAAEDLIGGPYVQIRTMRLLQETLGRVARGEAVVRPDRVRERPDGRLAVEVFPLSAVDRILFQGFHAEVFQRHGVTRENLEESTAVLHRQPEPSEGRVALVLGAGNVASIGPLDAVTKLFGEGQVVLLKLNPVNEYLGPFIERAFADLVADGFLRLAYGGAEVGDYLCRHAGVDEIHITGSARTHDIIVFGPGEEGERRRAEGRPRTTKRITSELGNVSPMIVVPGNWTERQLRVQAENLATQMTQNGGFNCNATKVIVTHREWPQREALLDRLGEVLASLPARPAYYPGALDRYAAFTARYPQAAAYGPEAEGAIRPTIIRDVDPAGEDELAFSTESFCAVTAETSLSAGDPSTYLERAVTFCNERLYGTLNAGIIVTPRERYRLGGAVDRAIEELRYGSVAVNHWPAISYALGSTTWGAYPGHELTDIQSGIGVVHNALLFDRPEKSVVEGPFDVKPKPAWFATHRNAYRVAERLVALEANPSLSRVPRLIVNALFG